MYNLTDKIMDEKRLVTFKCHVTTYIHIFRKPFFSSYILTIFEIDFDRFLIKECVLLSNPLLKSVLQRTVKQVAGVNIVLWKKK